MLQSTGGNSSAQALLKEVFKSEAMFRYAHEKSWRKQQRKQTPCPPKKRNRSGSARLRGLQNDTFPNPIGWGIAELMQQQQQQLTSKSIEPVPNHSRKQNPIDKQRRVANEKRPGCDFVPSHKIQPPYYRKKLTYAFYDSTGGIACLYPPVRNVAGATL